MPSVPCVARYSTKAARAVCWSISLTPGCRVPVGATATIRNQNRQYGAKWFSDRSHRTCFKVVLRWAMVYRTSTDDRSRRKVRSATGRRRSDQISSVEMVSEANRARADPEGRAGKSR